MAYFLIFVSFLAFGLGIIVLVSSKTVFQEIIACILFNISAVYFSGGAIVNAINEFRKSQK